MEPLILLLMRGKLNKHYMIPDRNKKIGRLIPSYFGLDLLSLFVDSNTHIVQKSGSMDRLAKSEFCS